VVTFMLRAAVSPTATLVSYLGLGRLFMSRQLRRLAA
jgi:hypothetical protein